MSTNIKHEAVYPPALFSLRRMAHQSPTRDGGKGSYPLFDPQLNASGSFGEKRVNGLGELAPGSPASVQDVKQVVVNLQRELEESKRKGSELQQMINDLSTPYSQTSTSSSDSQLLESSSNESVGENVKDAHIRHLQRQVTVLQANLYKCEGWASKVGAAMKERDKALDTVTRLTNEIKNLNGDKWQLQQRVDTLNTALQNTQQSLQQVTEDLQVQIQNGQLVLQLREEVHKQQVEIAHLKEALARLDFENRSLKDSGLSDDSNNQPQGSVPCSRELDHLHLVVDRLKRTVLEQRSFLINMKKPNANKRSLSTSASGAIMDGLLNPDFVTERKLSSPTLRNLGVSSTGSDGALGGHQLGYGYINQAMLASSQLETCEAKQPLQRNVSTPTFGQDFSPSGKRKFSAQDTLDEVFKMDEVMSPYTLLKQGDGFVGLDPKPVSFKESTTYTATGTHQRSPEFARQQGSGDVPEKKSELSVTCFGGQYSLSRSPQHRPSQSEVIAHRPGYEKVVPENWLSKSEVIGRSAQLSNQNLSTNKTPGGGFQAASGQGDKLSQAGSKMAADQVRRYPSPLPSQHDYRNGFKVGVTPTDGQRQQMFNGNSSVYEGNGVANQENVNRNSPSFHPQQIYHPSSNCQEESVRVLDHDMSTGGKRTAQSPSAHRLVSQAQGQNTVYVNTPIATNAVATGTPSPSVEFDPSRPRPNTDRLCPVCSNDYSHVSMEEFQTHVFECFDDENPPETMRPQPSPDKLCPMCNARFGAQTSQMDYEKHVHSHFGEDCLRDTFEILKP